MTINITILSVDVKTIPTAKGSYQQADIAFKNNTFQGKVEGKKLMSFGASKSTFETLTQAVSGETYNIETNKNDKGYIDWISATKSTAEAPQAASGGGQTFPLSKSAPSPKSTYETPEERAQRQVLIVRQSSISAAVSSLTPGAKVPLKAEDVITQAQLFEQYVFNGKKAQAGDTGFEDLPDFDMPPQVD